MLNRFVPAVALCILACSSENLSATVKQSALLPLVFEPNAGQVAANAKFTARSGAYTVLFSRRGFDFGPVSMRFRGASDHVSLQEGAPLPGQSNYLRGRDPSKWIIGLRQYAGIRYHNLYDGIDLVCHGEAGNLEYDFIVAPGADPGLVRLSFGSASIHVDAKVDARGELVVTSRNETWRQRIPKIYQGAQTVQGRFVAMKGGAIRLAVGAYDQRRPLVIDPVITYSTYLSGSMRNTSLTAMATDAAGNIYVTGSTNAPDYPTTAGSYNPKYVGGPCPAGSYQGSPLLAYCRDVFVSKLNPQGTSLLFSTYIGGTQTDDAYGIAVDASGNVYVTGATNSTDFPVTASARQTQNAGGELGDDAFLVKLDPSGAKLLYSTYLGGAGRDSGRAIAISPNGDLFLAGTTTSAGFPIVNAVQSQFGGGDCSADFTNEKYCSDAFVMRWRTLDMTLLASTYLGGNADDAANAMAIDGQGNVFIAGSSKSGNFPVIAPLQATLKGASNAFLAKFSPALDRVLFATYLGGSGADSASGVAVDSGGNAYLTGTTSSADFPLRNAAQVQPGGGTCFGIFGPSQTAHCTDAFVSMMRADGSSLVYSTYIGGRENDSGAAIIAAAGGTVWIGGNSKARTSFPVTPDAIHLCDSSNLSTGGGSGFLASLRPDGAIAYSTFLGGQGYVDILALTMDGSGNLLLAGDTNSSDFPVTSGALQTQYHEGGFVTKVDLRQSMPAGPTIDAGCIVNAASQTSGTRGLSKVVSPGEIVSIFGWGLGPPNGLAAAASGGSLPFSLAGVSVTFNGLPAPLLYVQAKQINAIVPFGVAGSQSAEVQVRYQGTVSSTVALAVIRQVPALFTTDMGGSGQVAAVNQDGTLNSPSNPAKRDSIVSVWATGLGLLRDTFADGQIAQSLSPLPAKQDFLQLGSSKVTVLYAGQAPGLVAGAIQINFQIPADADTGPAVLLTLAGTYPNVTIAVQ